MSWMPVEIRQTDSARTAPSASIGYGRIELSKSACDLIGKIERYPYAEPFMDADSDRAGIRLLRQPTPTSVPARPKSRKASVRAEPSFRRKPTCMNCSEARARGGRPRITPSPSNPGKNRGSF